MVTQNSVPPPTALTPDAHGLTVQERRQLLLWMEDARDYEIDAAEDLRLRPWPVPVTASVIGVFRSGQELASWFIVGQNGLWTVVAVTEGRVLATRPSLLEALTMIHRPGATPERRFFRGMRTDTEAE